MYAYTQRFHLVVAGLVVVLTSSVGGALPKGTSVSYLVLRLCLVVPPRLNGLNAVETNGEGPRCRLELAHDFRVVGIDHIVTIDFCEHHPDLHPCSTQRRLHLRTQGFSEGLIKRVNSHNELTPGLSISKVRETSGRFVDLTIAPSGWTVLL